VDLTQVLLDLIFQGLVLHRGLLGCSVGFPHDFRKIGCDSSPAHRLTRDAVPTALSTLEEPTAPVRQAVNHSKSASRNASKPLLVGVKLS
jgi:hypothetical protein